MSPGEMKATLAKMNDDAWHKQDLDAAYRTCSEDQDYIRELCR